MDMVFDNCRLIRVYISISNRLDCTTWREFSGSWLGRALCVVSLGKQNEKLTYRVNSRNLMWCKRKGRCWQWLQVFPFDSKLEHLARRWEHLSRLGDGDGDGQKEGMWRRPAVRLTPEQSRTSSGRLTKERHGCRRTSSSWTCFQRNKPVPAPILATLAPNMDV